MSLINQALRKAQRDRTSSRMPLPAGSTPAPDTGSAPAQGMQPNLLIGLIAGIALLIGLVAGLLVVVLQKDPPSMHQAIAPTPTPLGQSIVEAPAAPQPAPALVIEAAAPTNATPVARKAPSVLEELRIAREAAEAIAATEAAAAKKAEDAARVAQAKAALKPSQDIISWLGAAKVSGVRLSDTGSKVILNNKSYAVGETVHYGLGLKVLIIQEQRVLFVDGYGKKYLKQL